MIAELLAGAAIAAATHGAANGVRIISAVRQRAATAPAMRITASTAGG
jgi:hypothetical protein